MDRAASSDHIPDIFQRFNKADDLELIPMNSYYDTDDIFRNAFLTQNQSLNSYTSIRVDNLFGIDAVLTETGTGDKTTIRDLFKAAEDGENPFIHLIQYNSKRVNFLVKKDEEKWACDIINDFIYDYIAHHLTTESKALITTPDKAPRIIGSNQIPTQIAVYLQTAKKRQQQMKIIALPPTLPVHHVPSDKHMQQQRQMQLIVPDPQHPNLLETRQ